MRENPNLKIHFINVNHGDAIIIEFPDYGTNPKKAHFGIVDFGAKKAEDREHCKSYFESLVELRKGNDNELDYDIDFVCVTHPHDDHFGGLTRFMNEFRDKVKMFWDCGFRTNSITYNRIIDEIGNNDDITFVRVSAGAEFEFGNVRIFILGPSIDLRNRFDTYGVGKNDASIVLRIQLEKSSIILGADAEFASWGKITEEHPRRKTINFFNDALGMSERNEPSNQLKCDLLKVAHHGSKHGSTLEYLEILKPNRIVYTAGDDNWYANNMQNWANKFPHSLTKSIFSELKSNMKILNTGEVGNIIYTYKGNYGPVSTEPKKIKEKPNENNFKNALDQAW